MSCVLVFHSSSVCFLLLRRSSVFFYVPLYFFVISSRNDIKDDKRGRILKGRVVYLVQLQQCCVGSSSNTLSCSFAFSPFVLYLSRMCAVIIDEIGMTVVSCDNDDDYDGNVNFVLLTMQRKNFILVFVHTVSVMRSWRWKQNERGQVCWYNRNQSDMHLQPARIYLSRYISFAIPYKSLLLKSKKQSIYYVRSSSCTTNQPNWSKEELLLLSFSDCASCTLVVEWTTDIIMMMSFQQNKYTIQDNIV